MRTTSSRISTDRDLLGANDCETHAARFLVRISQRTSVEDPSYAIDGVQ